MWYVKCQCGHKDRYSTFARFMGRDLPANQWHCPACDCGWEVTKDGLRVIRQPIRAAA